MSSRGFTLVELLVTVSIIAILSAVGAAIYANVIEEGRDSKRQSDLRSIQSALEQYYSDQFAYPDSLPASGQSFKSPDNSKTYLNQMPSDPLGEPAYRYEKQGTSYCLYAKLENAPSANLSDCPSSSSYNFAVRPP